MAQSPAGIGPGDGGALYMAAHRVGTWQSRDETRRSARWRRGLVYRERGTAAVHRAAYFADLVTGVRKLPVGDLQLFTGWQCSGAWSSRRLGAAETGDLITAALRDRMWRSAAYRVLRLATTIVKTRAITGGVETHPGMHVAAALDPHRRAAPTRPRSRPRRQARWHSAVPPARLSGPERVV